MTSSNSKNAILILLIGLVLVYVNTTVRNCLTPHSGFVFGNTTTPKQLTAATTEGSFTPAHRDVFFTPNTMSRGSNVTIDRLRSMGLFLVNARVPYFCCNGPKTGVTLWSLFYLYVNNGIVVTKEETTRDAGVGYHKYINELKAQKTIYLNVSDSTLSSMVQRYDRILIARNPYVRFLSSYQDWQGRKKTHHVSFRQYAEWIENGDYKHLDEFKGYPMDHSLPVTWFCHYDALGYIVLRVEEQALWFNSLLERYQLTDKMQEYTEKSGNVVYTSALFDSALLSDYVPQMLGRQQFPSGHFSTHNRNSMGKLGQYYTPEIADICTRVFLNDFKIFHYPLWDGNNHTFSLV